MEFKMMEVWSWYEGETTDPATFVLAQAADAETGGMIRSAASWEKFAQRNGERQEMKELDRGFEAAKTELFPFCELRERSERWLIPQRTNRYRALISEPVRSESENALVRWKKVVLGQDPILAQVKFGSHASACTSSTYILKLVDSR